LSKDKEKYFQFEEYIHSCDEKEYSRDVRKKNYVIKYVNLLTVDNCDMVSLKRLATNLMFFRNTFTRESFLRFFVDSFGEEEKILLGDVVFDMFVRSKHGDYGEHKEFYNLSLELYKYVRYDSIIWDNWGKIKEELSGVV
jgi:hypothetical protein